MIIDLPAFAAAFGRAMHGGGVPVTPERSARFARALSLAPPADRSELYWTARAVFVSAHDQIAVFDRVFAAVFDGLIDPAGGPGDPERAGAARSLGDPGGRGCPVPPRETAGGLAARGASVTGSPEDSGEEELELPVAAATDAERLGERDFGSLEEDELHALRALMRGAGAGATAPPGSPPAA